MEEKKNEEIVNEQVEEVTAEVDPEVAEKEGEPEGAVADRPEKNWKAELARKNAEIERLRQEAETHKAQGGKRDQNDLSTWSDHELKAVLKDPSPAAAPYKDQIEDILLERKVRSVREKERMQEKRALSDLELRQNYPDALDPSSPLSAKIEEIMYQYDLQKSPAGRLAAAKLAAAELGVGRSKSSAKERKAEADRIARVKGQVNDGDRSKSTKGESPKNVEDIEARIKKETLTQADAFGEALKHAGIDRSSFFSGPGYTGRQK